ncbi:MAG: hypothetical protein Alpg2KO_24890 [Alphaproteobacteria bacterium]
MLLKQKHRRGASLLSYGLVVGLIAVVGLGAVTQIGDSVDSLFTQTSDTLANSIEAGSASAPAASATPVVSGASCKEILDGGGSTGNGSYTIDPDDGGPLGSITVDCDMDNGGLTMLTATQSWGATLGNMFVVFTDRNTAQTASFADWNTACSFYGLTRFTGDSHPGTGTGYSAGTHDSFTAARTFTTNVISTYSSSTLKADMLVLHGDVDSCWAHEHDSGSMNAFEIGGATGSSLFSYCRGGDSASKRYHIYMCNP